MDRGSSECWSRKGSGSGGASNNKQQAAERSGARSSSALLTPTQHSLMRKAEVTPDSEDRSNSLKAEMEFCRDRSRPARLTFHNDGLGGGGRQGNGVVIAAFGAEGIGLVHLPGEGSAGRTRHTRSNVRFPPQSRAKTGPGCSAPLTLSCCGDRGCGRQTGGGLRRNCWCVGERWFPWDRWSCLGRRGPLGGHRGPVRRLDRSARAPGPGPVVLGGKDRGHEGGVQTSPPFYGLFHAGAAHRSPGVPRSPTWAENLSV